jgi:hypothetical protein
MQHEKQLNESAASNVMKAVADRHDAKVPCREDQACGGFLGFSLLAKHLCAKVLADGRCPRRWQASTQSIALNKNT